MGVVCSAERQAGIDCGRAPGGVGQGEREVLVRPREDRASGTGADAAGEVSRSRGDPCSAPDYYFILFLPVAFM